MEHQNNLGEADEFIAPQQLFFNEIFGYTLVTTVVVSTYTIINLVAFIA